MRWLPGLLAPLAVAVLVSGCAGSSSAAGFSVSGATVDPTYACPAGANNSPYSLHATAELHNPTSRTVTVEAVSADVTLAAVKGQWLEKVGDVYRVSSADFAPASVNPQSDTAITVTIPSACTNGKAGTAGGYGDYSVRLHIVTTEGTYSISAAHDHRITT